MRRALKVEWMVLGHRDVNSTSNSKKKPFASTACVRIRIAKTFRLVAYNLF